MEWEQPSSSDPGSSYSNTYSHSNGNMYDNNNDYNISDNNRNSTTNGGLRRRHKAPDSFSSLSASSGLNSNSSGKGRKLKRTVVRNLDMFPKIERDLTVKSSSGSKLTFLAYSITVIIVLAEIYAFRKTNNTWKEHVVVDKSLNKKMRVDLNITFPALHCDDVHLDIMDVAGDAHNDVEDTIKKTKLHLDGSLYSKEEIMVEVNVAHKKETEILEAIDKTLAPNYCGPCYGASDDEADCCNHCDDVLDKYKMKKWNLYAIKMVAEQCIREGKTKPSKMKKGQGCNIAGHMTFNRVNGNFHIAMGEGVERNGQHIHTFIPDDVKNFNASHIINDLKFGPDYSYDLALPSTSEPTTLEGVKKIVTNDNGVSGMFQYFIKIVPTTYKGKNVVKTVEPDYALFGGTEPQVETNRYFTTERFTPLIMDIDDEHWKLGEMVANKFNQNHNTNANAEKREEEKKKKEEEKKIAKKESQERRRDSEHPNRHSYYEDDYYGFNYGGGMDDDLYEHSPIMYDDDVVDDNPYDDDQITEKENVIAGAKVGGNSGTSHHQHEHHRTQQGILPGIFFIYQVYPFAVEVTKESVPFTHLCIRILSTIGGVFTIVGMVDSILSRRK
mmetsp:Transcript_6037/g.7686  ORF Transcript_6037/g.7686 Transcript_6037/m.7686 type:complete len:611 (+) Transcript_6037:44-1876(+)